MKQLFPFEQDGLYGYKGQRGNIIIKPKYQAATNFVGERAWVQSSENKLWTIIDMNGKELFEPIYKNAQYFHERRACVQNEYDQWGFIDVNGNVIVEPKYTDAGCFHRGRAMVKHTNNLWGYIDLSVREAIAPIYGWVDTFDEDYALVRCSKDVNPTGKTDTFGFVIDRPTIRI